MGGAPPTMPTAASRLHTRPCPPPPRLHFYAPTGGASARDTTTQMPRRPARLL